MIKFSIPPALDQCRSAALAYAKMGWAVFPAPTSGEKKSLKSARRTKNGQPWGKTTDPDEIRSDYAKWKNANVGIATGAASKIWVLDLDVKEGVDGIRSLAALEQQYGGLPATLKAASPSGSVHYYWLWPADRSVHNSTSVIAPGIDVRGEGGMVLAPPSVRPGKGKYAWTSITPPVEAPDWLLDLAIRANDSSQVRVSGEPEALPEVIAAALEVIPNDDLDWENWNRIGMAAFRASGGQGLTAFDAWSRKSNKYRAQDVSERWHNYSKYPPDQIGAGTLFFMANEADPTWQDAWHDRVLREIEEADAAYDRAYADRNGEQKERVDQNGLHDQDEHFARTTDESEQKDRDQAAQDEPTDQSESKPPPQPEPPPKPQLISSIEDWIARDIEPPDFICGRWLTTTSRAILSGDTGLGKTLFALALGMRCSAGLPFLHWQGVRPCRVLYVDGEMSRRVIGDSD
jgi:Bifunctional DNA primase/polymerase, N-terminal/Primase C terminal 2 (PriCT-2)/AAA domain